MVIVAVSPLKSPASGLNTVVDRLNPSCCGKPVLTVSCSDWLVITSLVSVSTAVATTRTGVGTVPDNTRTLAIPWELVRLCAFAVPLAKLKPPTTVSKVKLTFCCAAGWPLALVTLKLTKEDSLEPVPPAPLMRICAGSADSKLKLASVWRCSVNRKFAVSV